MSSQENKAGVELQISKDSQTIEELQKLNKHLEEQLKIKRKIEKVYLALLFTLSVVSLMLFQSQETWYKAFQNSNEARSKDMQHYSAIMERMLPKK